MNARLAIAALAVAASASVASPGTTALAASDPPFEVPAGSLAAAVNCPSGFHHPEHDAVLLVHGTSVTADENWGWNYLLALPRAGFDVCTVQMPDRALGDMQVSVEYVVWAIRETARRSGRKVDTIGISQGGIEPRWALRFWPGIHTLVAKYIAMAATNHGAIFGNADCVSSCPPALWQQTIGSQYLAALNRVETPYRQDVAYTSVYSLTDEIIQPAAGPSGPTSALDGAANIAVQDICPGRYVDHIQSAWDAAYYAVVLDALTHSGPADPARIDRSYCSMQAMPMVDPVVGWQQTAELYVKAGAVQAQYSNKPSHEPPLRCYATVVGCPVGPSTGVGAASSPASNRGAVAAGSAGLPATSAVAPGLGPVSAVVLLAVFAMRCRRRMATTGGAGRAQRTPPRRRRSSLR